MWIECNERLNHRSPQRHPSQRRAIAPERPAVRILLRFLVKPTSLLLSAGLHAIALMLPLPEAIEPEEPDTPTPAPVAMVTLADLLATSANTPATSPERNAIDTEAIAPPPAETSKPNSPEPEIPELQISESDTSPPKPPESRPSPEPASEPDPPVDPSTTEASPPEEETPDALEEPTSDTPPEGDLQDFLATLSPSGAIAPVTPDMLPQPEALFTTTAPPTLKPDILRTAAIAAQTPEELYITILVGSQESGFQSNQQADYGGGLVYHVTRGDRQWYFNLIPTLDGGTAIVVWQHEPA